MSEKEVMDYKKQRTGKPSAVTSLSIKQSNASLNEDSDSETISVTSTKRKHKVTQQCYNKEVNMGDVEDMEDAEDMEDIHYHQSVQNDDDDDDGDDDDEVFFDCESVDSSYTIFPSKSIPESLLNETPSRCINREETTLTNTSNIVHSSDSTSANSSPAVFETHNSVHDENNQAEDSSDILSSSCFSRSSSSPPNSPIASLSGSIAYENPVNNLHTERDGTESVSDCESFHDYNITKVVDRDENNTKMLSNVSNNSPLLLNIESGNLALPEIANDGLDQNVDKDNELFESLLVTMNNAVYSSSDESEYNSDSEMSEVVGAETIEILDSDMSEAIDVTVPEMLINETSEEIDEQYRIDIEKMLHAMNESVYSDDLPTTVEDAIFTNHNLGENTPDELLITGYEMDIEPFANIFSMESDSVNERCSPGPIQRTVDEIMKRSHAEMMAAVEKTIKENLTTVRTNNNSSVSGGSLSVNMEPTTRNNQLEELDDTESDDISFVASANFDHRPSMRMWWYDAYESYEGFIYLFGKIFDEASNAYTSCCITVENIQREIYVLPRKYRVDENGNPTRQPVALNDAMLELKDLLESNNVINYQMETCRRKYAFGMPDVPREAEYIKLNYPYTDYRLPQEATCLTFNNIFGTTVSPLEGFLIQKNIMGPCWLEFNNLQSSEGNFWCSVEARIESPIDCLVVESDDTPPLNSLALSIQTKFNYSTKNNEIIAITGYYCKNVNINEQDIATLSPSERFSVTRPISSSPSFERTVINPEVDFTIIQETSEEALLRAFLAKLRSLDPDIIIGHEFSTVGLSILLQRMKFFNVKKWNVIGRRMCATLNLLAKVSVRIERYRQDHIPGKTNNVRLQDMALSELGLSREEITSDMMATFEQQGILATELARYGSFDSYLTMSIAETYGYICPDRPDWKTGFKEPLFVDENNLELCSSRKEKAESYAGGLVLDPKTGLYDDYILLLDFNSLYPSIIQEYNVCFTTMEQDYTNSVNYNAQDIPSTPSPDVDEGILPKLVDIFVNRRKEVKHLMENRDLPANIMSQYNIEQLALKLTANSMYGCLGSPTSRFYARQLAMYITSKGRRILKSTVDTTEQLGYDVVYGDTDSIMVNTQTKVFDVAKQVAEKVKEAVNQKYKLLEIGVDGYFKSTLLLKKKKYAMLSVEEGPDKLGLTEKVEIKGLDLVRRDWCNLSRSISENVLGLILLGEKSPAILEYLVSISNKIHNTEYNVDKFIIRKKLNKSPDEYDSLKSLPHVSVAKNMRRDRVPIKVGDVIAYVMCKSGLPDDSGIKACRPEEVKKGKAEISKLL
ncbi:hypothetical protein MFLAVUS_007615 [Mucor flavus]|uniref:DNA polymerase n=1 Tax=Mucor flavus TaxID=439312 RepID=A0ABP9Z4T1_9FUNG